MQVDVSRVRTGSLQRLPVERASCSWREVLPALTVIAPSTGRRARRVTMKRNGLLSFGSLEAGGKRFRLDGGVGGIDYAEYLARLHGLALDASPGGWRIRNAHRPESRRGLQRARPRPANAYASWGQLYPLARAFEYDAKNLMGPWKADDGGRRGGPALQPFYVHREA